jgi:pyrroline-5-carboxylate reductase
VDISKIAILGSGSMGTAILRGLLKAGFDSANVAVSTKSTLSASRLAAELGISAFAAEENAQANSLAVSGAEVVLVAVKPMYVASVLSEVEAAVPDSVAVIRSMPNTPAIVGRAVTGLSRGSRASQEQLTLATSLFETVGQVVVLPEEQIDALGTISGSGPAYVFYLVEQFTEAAKNMGFDEATAANLVTQTFLGATELLVASGKTPQELRKQVTSPNGTTMQAIAKLEAGNLAELFTEATNAALARSKEIAAGK